MADDPEKAVHFEILDFKGNRIICTEIRWQDHVVGYSRHIDLIEQEELVTQALTHPCTSMRYHDTSEPKRMVYYGDGGITRYVKVTVEFKDATCTGDGFLITAYPTDNMKPKEIPEWPIK